MKLSQKLITISASWSADPFRPNLQLKEFLKSLSSHPNLTHQAVNAAQSLRENDVQKKVHMSSSRPDDALTRCIFVVSSVKKVVATAFYALPLRSARRSVRKELERH